MRIAMLDMEKFDNRKFNSVGSSRIRGRWMRKYCPQIEEFSNGIRYDAVIYQKAYYFTHMKRFEGIKIFDMCDPDWLEGRKVVEVSEMVDAFTVTTQAIHDFIVQLTDKPVIIIPDRIDPDEHVPVKEEHYGKARSVIWYGYSSNQVALDQCMIPIRDRLLSLAVASERGYREADINIIYDYSTINEEIIKHDMVILPDYSHDKRHRYKSNNKTLSAWALKMPVATSPEDLDRFMDPVARTEEANMRYNYVIKECHSKDSGPQYLELINSLKK